MLKKITSKIALLIAILISSICVDEGQFANASNNEQCVFDATSVLCRVDEAGLATSDFVVVGEFTNCQNIPGSRLVLAPTATIPPTVDVCFGDGSLVLPLNPPIGLGDSVTVGSDLSNADAIILKNAAPGDLVCFLMSLLGLDGQVICEMEVCLEMPACDCFQIDHRFDRFEEIICHDDGTMDFVYSFQITNLSGVDKYHAFLASTGSEMFVPDYLDLFALNGNTPLAHGQSVFVTTQVLGAQPES